VSEREDEDEVRCCDCDARSGRVKWSGECAECWSVTRSDTRSTGGEGFVIGEGFDVAWIIADDEYDE